MSVVLTLTFSQLSKDLVDIVSRPGTGAEVVQAQLARELLGLLELDLPVLLQVALVANDYYRQVVAALLSELLDPVAHPFERIDVRDVVHDQGPLSVPVIDVVQGMVLLLPGRVPDGELVGRTFARRHRVVDPTHLLQASGVDSAFLGVAELVVCESDRDGGLSDSLCGTG